MRIRYMIKNMRVSFLSYGILFVFTFVIRRISLQYFGVEFAGYEGLFTSLFTILSMAELGVGSNIISYHLYHAFSAQDEREISILVNIYKRVYHVIGFVILACGIFCSFFLEFFISGRSMGWGTIRLIYFLQLCAMLCTYFLSYPRAVFQAAQREYVFIRADAATNIVINLVKMFCIIKYNNYYAYLFLTIVRHTVSNLILQYRCRKEYSFIKKEAVTLDMLKERMLLKDIKNYLWHQFAGTVFWGTDAIIISKYAGMILAGKYNNYFLIKSQLRAVITNLFHPLQAAVGNLVYSENSEKRRAVFQITEMGGHLLAVFVSVTAFILIQPFVAIVFGTEYVLPLPFTAMLSMNLFLEIIREFQSYFRFAYGEYEKDRAYVASAAWANLLLSIAFIRPFGLAGITFGTLIGNLIIWFGNVVFFKERFITGGIAKYAAKHILWWCAGAAEGGCIYLLVKGCPASLYGIAVRLLVCNLFLFCLNFMLFGKTEEMQLLKRYIRETVQRNRG